MVRVAWLFVAAGLTASCSRSERAAVADRREATAHPATRDTAPSIPHTERADSTPVGRFISPYSLSRTGLDSLVGTKPDRPSAIAASSEHMGGWMLTAADVPLSNYGVHHARLRNREFLTFDSLAGREGAHAIWQVLDAIWIPEHPDSLVFAFACAYDRQLQSGDSTPDYGIMGIAVPEEAQFYSKVIVAWRADTLTGRFHLVDPAQLRCYNEGWGAD